MYSYHRRWRRDGTWERIHRILRILREWLRLRLGRDPQPSAGSIDSQSVKTSGVGGLRGFDSGKKVKGRKRHLLVDTEVLVLRAVVHPANIMDRDGVKLVLHEPVQTDFPRLHHVWPDCMLWLRTRARARVNIRSPLEGGMRRLSMGLEALRW